MIGAGAFNKVLLDSNWNDNCRYGERITYFTDIIRVGNCGTNPNCNWIGNCFYDDSGWYCCADCDTPGVNVELLALATGAGSLILSHVNDSGFWMIKEYFGMTVKETLLTWTAMETILSVVALGLISILNIFV